MGQCAMKFLERIYSFFLLLVWVNPGEKNGPSRILMG